MRLSPMPEPFDIEQPTAEPLSWGQAALFGAVYFLLAVLAIWVSRQPGSVAVIWYANAVVVLAVAGARAGARWRLLAAVALACPAANVVGGSSWAVALGLTAANLLEISLGAALVQHRLKLSDALIQPWAMLRLIAAVGLLAALPSSLLGAGVIAWAYGAEWTRVAGAWVLSALIGATSMIPLMAMVQVEGWGPVGRALGRGRTAVGLLVAIAVALGALRVADFPLVYVASALILTLAIGGAQTTYLAGSVASLIFVVGAGTGLFVLPPIEGLDDLLQVFVALVLTIAMPVMLASAVEGNRRATERLNSQSRTIRRAYQHSPALLVSLDTKGRIVDASDRWLAWIGYTADRVRGTDLRELMADGTGRLLDRVLAAGPEVPAPHRAMPVQVRLFTGQHREAELSAVWEEDARSGQARLLTVMVDVTERNAVKDELERKDELFEHTNRLASVGAWSLDLLTNELYWSQETCRIHGVPVGYRPTIAEALDFYPSEAATQMAEAVQHGINSGAPWDVVLPLVPRGGQQIMVRTLGVAHRDQHGRPIRLVGAIQDITVQQHLIESLHQAKQAADQANAAKSMFLANMSHEIRTPLNALLGMHQLLLKTPLEDSQRVLVNKAEHAGRGLLETLNDVLDLSKIEAGEMILHPECFALDQLLDEVVQVYGETAAAQGIDLMSCFQLPRPHWVVGDRVRLRQVLSNLVSNAIKFTPQGHVRVTVERPAQGDPGRVRVRVEDTGIGIPPEAQERLFAPFTQAERSTARRFGGTGLGLSIVRRLAGLMDGEVHVRSAAGQGSTFTVDLALPEAAAAEVQARQAAQRAVTLGVLAAEPEALSALHRLAERLGWQTIDRSADRVTPVDAIVADATVGTEKVLAARSPADSRAPDPLETPVFIAGVPPDTSLPATSGVFTEASPLTSAALLSRVMAELAQSDTTMERLLNAPAALTGGARWLEGLKVLVVDDVALNREVACGLLKSQGADCEEFEGGLAVIDRMRGRHEDVDAVLMDIQMPVVDGLEATRQIRALVGERLPIIALTAGIMFSERARALDGGMDDFLPKPLETLSLVRTLRRLVGRFRATALPVGFHPASSPAPDDTSPHDTAMPAAAPVWPALPGIDLQEARAHLLDSLPLFERSLDIFGSTYHDWSVRTGPLLMSDPPDIDGICAHLHKLRGSASMLGATALATATDRAERRLRAGRSAIDPVGELRPVNELMTPLLAAVMAWKADREGNSASTEGSDRAAPGPEELARVRRLCHLLDQADLDALELLRSMHDTLSRWLGSARCRAMEQQIEALDFAGPCAQLRGALASIASASTGQSDTPL